MNAGSSACAGRVASGSGLAMNVSVCSDASNKAAEFRAVAIPVWWLGTFNSSQVLRVLITGCLVPASGGTIPTGEKDIAQKLLIINIF